MIYTIIQYLFYHQTRLNATKKEGGDGRGFWRRRQNLPECGMHCGRDAECGIIAVNTLEVRRQRIGTGKTGTGSRLFTPILL